MGPSKEHILLLTNTYLHEHKAQFWINRNTQSGHIGLEEHRTQNVREKEPFPLSIKTKSIYTEIDSFQWKFNKYNMFQLIPVTRFRKRLYCTERKTCFTLGF